MKIRTKITLLLICFYLISVGIITGIATSWSKNGAIENVKELKRPAFELQMREYRKKITGIPNQGVDPLVYKEYCFGQVFDEYYILVTENRNMHNISPYDFAYNTGWVKEDEISHRIEQVGSKKILILGTLTEEKDIVIYYKDITYIYEATRRMVITIIAISVVFMLFMCVLLSLIIRRMFRPFYQLKTVSQQISCGDFSRRVSEYRQDEIGEVSRTFNYMADTIEKNIETLTYANDMQQRLLGSLTHEIKTPMTAIIGYSETLLKVKLSPENTKVALTYINREGKRLESLSNKMMQLIGLYENDTITLQPHCMRELIHRVVEITKYTLKEAQVSLKVMYEGDREKDNKVVMDLELMESVLVNLIDNSRKASLVGGEIHLIVNENEIKVKDQGKGIPEEELNYVRQAFYMVDKARAKQQGSVGLGLSLCETIVSYHKGRMEIESKLGEGTTVVIHLP